jgi:hypothetical protein
VTRQANHNHSGTNGREKNLIVSYLAMRRLVGILGTALPVLLIVGGLIQNGWCVQGSISGYYYTNMRDIFVGILGGVALILLSYKGYEEIDNTVCSLGGFSALGIIAFPTSMNAGHVERVGIFLVNDDISGLLHLAFSMVFFLALSYNALFLFTRRSVGGYAKQKARRNLIYRICGVIMLVSIAFMTVYTVFLRETAVAKSYPVLVFESVACLAFGVSWLVKGNTLFRDSRG